MSSWKLTPILAVYLAVFISCAQQRKRKIVEGTTKIAFGGCLQEIEKNSNDTSLDLAIKVAVERASKRFAKKFPRDTHGNILPYKIEGSKIAKIMYTHDGSIPFIVQIFNEKTGRPHNMPLIWGLVYSFSLLWDHPEDELGLRHSFVLFRYWDDNFYTFEHTFHQPEYRGLPESKKLYQEIPQVDIQPLNRYTHTMESVEHLSITPVLKHKEKHLSGTKKNDLLHEGDKTTYSPKHDSDKGFLDAEPSSHDHKSSCLKYGIRDAVALKNEFLNLAQGKCSKEESHRTGSKSDIGDNHFHTENPHIIDYSYKSQTFKHLKNISSTLKVLSFNVWNFNIVTGEEKHYEKRMKHLSKLCRDSKADVIGFQEVRFQDGKGGRLGPNQMDHLIKDMPEYQYIYQPAQIQIDGLPKFVAEGLAFLSKYPITSHDYLLLKRNPRDGADGHQRVLLHIEVDLPSFGKTHFFNTHLSLSHKARATSVVQIWKYMEKFKGPAFLMGDFNSEAHNVEVKFLDGQRELKKTKTEGLHDVWKLKHGHESKGFTFNALETELSKRIDIIFMRQHPSVNLEDVSLLDDGKRGESAASDHLGLLAVFKSTS